MNPKHKATNAVTEILGVEVQADSNVAKVFLSAIQALDSKVELLNDHLAEHGVPTKSPTSIPFGNNANLGALQTGENASTNSETNKKETNFEDTVEVANVAEQVGDRVYVETSGGDVLGISLPVTKQLIAKNWLYRLAKTSGKTIKRSMS